MPDTIRSGVGNSYLAEVDEDNRLQVYSKSASSQHVVSEDSQEAFQVIGTATLASGTVVGLHIKNTSSTKRIVLSYIRHQIIDHAGGTALPNASCYFRIALGRTWSSGGSTATPVNVYSGSGTTVSATIYQGAPTLAGTALEIDRWYTKAEADMNTFNKDGALIIPPNQTIELAYVGDHTSGTLYCRASFYLEDH